MLCGNSLLFIFPHGPSDYLTRLHYPSGKKRSFRDSLILCRAKPVRQMGPDGWIPHGGGAGWVIPPPSASAAENEASRANPQKRHRPLPPNQQALGTNACWALAPAGHSAIGSCRPIEDHLFLFLLCFCFYVSRYNCNYQTTSVTTWNFWIFPRLFICLKHIEFLVCWICRGSLPCQPH